MIYLLFKLLLFFVATSLNQHDIFVVPHSIDVWYFVILVCLFLPIKYYCAPSRNDYHNWFEKNILIRQYHCIESYKYVSFSDCDVFLVIIVVIVLGKIAHSLNDYLFEQCAYTFYPISLTFENTLHT